MRRVESPSPPPLRALGGAGVSPHGEMQCLPTPSFPALTRVARRVPRQMDDPSCSGRPTSNSSHRKDRQRPPGGAMSTGRQGSPPPAATLQWGSGVDYDHYDGVVSTGQAFLSVKFEKVIKG